MIISENGCQFLVQIRSYVLEKTAIEIALNANECIRWIEPIHTESGSSFRPPKKICYVALSRPTVKCEKTGSGSYFFLFIFFMSDLGEEFAKICIQWLKKHLYICVLTAFRLSFPHLETFKKILENSTLTVRKKKKKKNRPTDPIFRFWSGEGNITIFFWPYGAHSQCRN